MSNSEKLATLGTQDKVCVPNVASLSELLIVVLVFCVVCIRPLFCVPNVASFSELLIVVLVFCVVCIHPLSCVPNVASFSELLIVVLNTNNTEN
jgi:hypothetical protein